jgi:HEAT repeat protein
MQTDSNQRAPAPTKGAADDILPPVTPPTAGFLLQLFLIPLIIVGIIVMVWLMFSWLAHMGGDPRDLVRKLQKGDDASWQAALTLADLIRDPQQKHLKYDEKLAADLGDVLKKQLASAQSEENQINLCVFLCKALGEFSTPEAAPALIEAAKSETAAADVRREAVRALALLASNLGPEQFQKNGPAMQAIYAAAGERGGEGDDRKHRAELRSSAAYALGVIGGDEALGRLARLLDDADPNVRYNAATGLARHGDARAIPVLVEMLDPANDDAVGGEKSESGREWKQGLVNINGVKAAAMLAEKNDSADMDPLQKALEELAKSAGPTRVRNEAREAIARMDER